MRQFPQSFLFVFRRRDVLTHSLSQKRLINLAQLNFSPSAPPKKKG
jgi:hypothetical protein